MNNDLKNKLDQFIDEFLEVKEVKQYLLLKEEILSSDEIKELEKNLKQAQKDVALSLGKPNYEENKQRYFSLKKEYDEHPLIVNFNVMQEEVSYLLNYLQDKLQVK